MAGSAILSFPVAPTTQIHSSNCVVWVGLVICEGEIRIFGHDAVRCGRTLLAGLDCVFKSEAICVVHLEAWPGTEKFITWSTTVLGVHALGLFVALGANAMLPRPCLCRDNFFWKVAFIESLLGVHRQNPSGWIVECVIMVSFCH